MMHSNIHNKVQSDVILEAIPIAVVWVNNQGVVDWLNAAAIELLADDWQGRTWEQVMQHCFKEMKSDGLEVATQDGRLLQVVLSTIDDQPGQLISLVDVTPSRTLQKHIAHQQRLSSIGQMTAQLAHQLRTPLASATLLAERLAQTVVGDKEIRLIEQLNQCHQSIERQIQDLLAYCRGEHLAKEQTQVVNWFSHWQTLVQTSLTDQSIELIYECDVNKSCYMNANAEALNGCLFNLLDNALQAEASCIKIKIYPIWDALIAIDFQDNGVGMDKSVVEKVSEPFFTTKAKGTGLGLAVVESIINQHAGTITIESAPEVGTLVRLILPLSY